MTRKNEGVFEPEIRLVLVAAQMILGCASLFGVTRQKILSQ